ncbi:MAG: carboxylesterase family protein [Microbacterium sp.]
MAATATGEVAGLAVETAHGPVRVYRGVPYADAERFRPPAAPPAWSGVRDATRDSAAVPQNPDLAFSMLGLPQAPWSEHGSLTANVWAPGSSHGVASDALPVMVWVHGGGYVTGSNSSPMNDPLPLAAAERVVVVALNYRLGVFGFPPAAPLLGEGYEDAANLGLLDLVAGLEWVQQNIAAFGGDPARVTVFGESAGGAAVATLLGMPRSRGLFSRAIVQSGTAERARTADEAAVAAELFLHGAGLPPASARELLTWPAERLLEAQESFTALVARESVGLPLPFLPAIDGRSLPALPLEAIAAGEGDEVELIVGTNRNEAGLFRAFGPPSTPAQDAQRLEDLVSRVLGATDSCEYVEAVSAARRAEVDAGDALEAFLTDVQYRQPTNRLLAARARAGVAPTRAYQFCWPSPAFGGRLGSVHTLEIPFVFGLTDRPEHQLFLEGAAPAALSQAMMQAWGGFARTGVPTSPLLPPWPAHDADERLTMVFDETSRVASDPYGPLRRFWIDARSPGRG